MKPDKQHKRQIKITEDYITEKIEAYNVAIEALKMHESADPINWQMGKKLKLKLAKKIDNECQRWCQEYMKMKR